MLNATFSCTKKRLMKLLVLKWSLCFLTLSFAACSQNDVEIQTDENKKELEAEKENHSVKAHNYGGWYCPDNLNGFPAVDIKDWNKVPVINGRMATKEETQNGSSLINVDLEKYPNAKILDMKMPKLARYFNHSSGKNELVIVIQALNIANDSVVGFRYLNGGNGSSWLHEVEFLSEAEAEIIPSSHFVAIDVHIKAPETKVWKVMTDTSYMTQFADLISFSPQPSFHWRKESNINFNYPRAGNITGQFAGNHFGMKYIQNDYKKEDQQYVEKILLHEGDNGSEMKMVFGPFTNDYKEQNERINQWAKRVKQLSEAKHY